MTFIVEARYRSGFAWHKPACALATMAMKNGLPEGISMMKRTLILACAAIIALSGCGNSDESGKSERSTESSAPDAKPGLSVADGVLVLPAVKGNPGVAYFSVTNGNETPTSLAAVNVDGVGKTEMHETMAGKMEPLNWAQLEGGQTVRFERGGKHIMLFELANTLKPGGTAEMTLTFSGGDKLSTPLKIEAPGGMTGMDHGSEH